MFILATKFSFSTVPPCTRDSDQDPSIKKQKKLRWTMISTVLWLLNDILSLKTDVNLPIVRKKIFLGILTPLHKITGSGSVIQCTDPDPFQNVTEPPCNYCTPIPVPPPLQFPSANKHMEPNTVLSNVCFGWVFLRRLTIAVPWLF